MVPASEPLLADKPRFDALIERYRMAVIPDARRVRGRDGAALVGISRHAISSSGKPTTHAAGPAGRLPGPREVDGRTAQR
jgi:hypothetical protein